MYKFTCGAPIVYGNGDLVDITKEPFTLAKCSIRVARAGERCVYHAAGWDRWGIPTVAEQGGGAVDYSRDDRPFGDPDSEEKDD